MTRPARCCRRRISGNCRRPPDDARRHRLCAHPDMLSRFYKRFSGVILWAVALSFPYLYYEAQSIPCNNDIETWLPRESPVRATYEQFKRDFGVEETILIGIERRFAADDLIEAVGGRIERLPPDRRSLSTQRLQRATAHTGGSADASRRRP